MILLYYKVDRIDKNKIIMKILPIKLDYKPII